ncbi:hypothetical protein [Schleiferilactobacillus perolens]|jgi:hypothetical protein|uniref:Uncharacterized protein n=1 Tax=Schleiferilactobacillus perolens DSM 12744 TaxID=1423792 RepID=A0A0R1N602_9LACO|nr:hypothetical protein [Schleiferilactobacillus perolens]KRL12371.1 hypothetical protein FD09_GL002951 [Schleiferilactobacillus perolens DSM 12744]MCI1913972.1 hypothetical protein [Schleiferilactobacillus harbinensis]MCI2170822.1 hypothetical protein [Schleiferilactobacillus perolens]
MMAENDKKDNAKEQAPKVEIKDDVKALGKTLMSRGYITEKDTANMKDAVYAKALAKAIDKEVRSESEDPFIQFESFDYQNGIIKNIIFNMDIIKTRDDAMDTLSAELGEKEIKITKQAEEEINEIGKA